MTTDPPSRTTTRLLEGLGREGAAAWEEVDRRFRPVLLAVARRAGLSEIDAAEVAQEALVDVVDAFRAGRYERGRGRLSAWVLGIARHRIVDRWRERSQWRKARGESALGELPGSGELEELWEAEYRGELLARAFELLERAGGLRPSSVEAFRLLVTEELAPREVAERLGLTVGAVYSAKHQCATRMTELVRELEEAGDALDPR